MRLRLDSKWIERLTQLPESGMGYQRVRVSLRGGRVIEPAVVHNAEFLEVADDTVAFTEGEIANIELVTPHSGGVA